MNHLIRWLAGLAIAVYALARAAGATHNRHHDRWQWTGTKLALILAALAVIVAIASSRYHRRKDHKARIGQAMGGVLGKKHVEPVTIERARFHKGQLTDVIATHGHHVNSLDRGMRKEMGDVMAAHFNSPVEVEWRPDKSAVRVRRAEPEAPDMSPTGRVRTAVRLAIGAGAQVDNVRYGEDGTTPIAFRVSYPATASAAGAEWRRKADATICEMTGQNWASSWTPHADNVAYRLVPSLPDFVPHPVDAMPGSTALPFGVAAHGQFVSWEPDSQTPHALIIGTTGAGKTCLLRTIVCAAVRRGYRVSIADTKRISLRALRTWPGVVTYATRLEDMAALVERTYLEVERRYTEIEADRLDHDDLQPILLVVEEATELIGRCRAAHKAAKLPGEPPVVEHLQSCLRLGRECRVHICMAQQRPDIESGLSGEARDNLGYKVTLGKVSRYAQAMTDTKTAVKGTVRGRAVVSEAGEETVCQCFWTPDMARTVSGADQAILDALRPTDEQVPPRPELTLVPDAENQGEGEDTAQ